MIRCLVLSLILVVTWCLAACSQTVVRDSIGPDSSLTDGLPGGSTFHEAGTFSTPGLVFEMPEPGILVEARFVIFARGPDELPENDIANIYGYPMDFHVWTEGIVGGPDSFDENPSAEMIGGHIFIEDVNQTDQSFITVQEWGLTGPPNDPDLFTTFLITVDLTSFEVELEAGEFVMSIIQHDQENFITGGGFFRIIGSTATGKTEDLFREESSTTSPGYVCTQLGFPFCQYAGYLAIDPHILGDVDQNGVVNLLDVDPFIERVGTGTYQYEADCNQDGDVNLLDIEPFIAILGGG